MGNSVCVHEKFFTRGTREVRIKVRGTWKLHTFDDLQREVNKYEIDHQTVLHVDNPYAAILALFYLRACEAKYDDCHSIGIFFEQLCQHRFVPERERCNEELLRHIDHMKLIKVAAGTISSLLRIPDVSFIRCSAGDECGWKTIIGTKEETFFHHVNGQLQQSQLFRTNTLNRVVTELWSHEPKEEVGCFRTADTLKNHINIEAYNDMVLTLLRDFDNEPPDTAATMKHKLLMLLSCPFDLGSDIQAPCAWFILRMVRDDPKIIERNWRLKRVWAKRTYPAFRDVPAETLAYLALTPDTKTVAYPSSSQTIARPTLNIEGECAMTRLFIENDGHIDMPHTPAKAVLKVARELPVVELVDRKNTDQAFDTVKFIIAVLKVNRRRLPLVDWGPQYANHDIDSYFKDPKNHTTCTTFFSLDGAGCGAFLNLFESLAPPHTRFLIESVLEMLAWSARMCYSEDQKEMSDFGPVKERFELSPNLAAFYGIDDPDIANTMHVRLYRVWDDLVKELQYSEGRKFQFDVLFKGGVHHRGFAVRPYAVNMVGHRVTLFDRHRQNRNRWCAKLDAFTQGDGPWDKKVAQMYHTVFTTDDPVFLAVLRIVCENNKIPLDNLCKPISPESQTHVCVQICQEMVQSELRSKKNLLPFPYDSLIADLLTSVCHYYGMKLSGTEDCILFPSAFETALRRDVSVFVDHPGEYDVGKLGLTLDQFIEGVTQELRGNYENEAKWQMRAHLQRARQGSPPPPPPPPDKEEEVEVYRTPSPPVVPPQPAVPDNNESDSDSDFDADCRICMIAKPKVVFLPCKHQSCCAECTEGLDPRICPICRAPIRDSFAPLRA